jgi:Uncharacterized protein conserved in bacteria (DUF2188)
MSEVHIIPDDLMTWRVFDAGAPAPVSEHTSATDAELAARKHAEDYGADRVVIHDRTYDDAAASPVGPGARALRTRARQVDAAREQARRPARAGYSGSR